jgi:hypothetical protein
LKSFEDDEVVEAMLLQLLIVLYTFLLGFTLLFFVMDTSVAAPTLRKGTGADSAL